MRQLRLVIVGPGRAGGSIAIASSRAGHEVRAVVPGPSGSLPAPLADVPILERGSPIPDCDLLVIAVRDDVIGEVADTIRTESTGIAVHLSGFTSVAALEPLRLRGWETGSIHPLQSLLDPLRGADALRGSFAAVTAGGAAAPILASFVRSVGMRPFPLADADKQVHHAAAAAASNFLVSALAIASELAAHSGVPLEAYASLSRAVVDNVYEHGAASALTGPVARGDLGTVAGQLEAAGSVSAELRARYAAMVEATARMAGRWDDFAPLVQRP